MPFEPVITTNDVDDHDLDERATSPVPRVVFDPPDVVHTQLVCDRGGIEIWAERDDEELS